MYNIFMVSLGEKSQKKRGKHNIQKAVLSTIAVAGLLSAALVAPGALHALKLFGFTPQH